MASGDALMLTVATLDYTLFFFFINWDGCLMQSCRTKGGAGFYGVSSLFSLSKRVWAARAVCWNWCIFGNFADSKGEKSGAEECRDKGGC
jgi:hypothetical protein